MEQTFGGPLDDSAYSLSVTSDDGYVLVGKYTESYSYGTDGSAFILKTDSKGNQEWMKVFSNCTLYSVQQTSDSGYIAAGVKNGNAWLVKLAGDKEGTHYEDRKNNESERGNGTESESAESAEYGNTSDSFFDQIRYYIYDTFNGFFQWDYYT